MVPYMSFTWQAFVDTLRDHASATREDGRLWLSVLQTLSKALSADEDKGTYLHLM